MSAPPPTKPVPLWTPAQVAEYLAVPEDRLARWRCDRVGPPFVKIGRSVRYHPRQVARWLQGQTRKTNE
ncbi:helix-turn-helix domain-containing protein [Brevibacterium otitidis]|uniref:Helix-turn-helix domain-containing protein n=1 Tax=Brevibacterium otitidis TaxID=53364 RepID=A0ABV5WZC5_9MICO|nr:hypothetical protein GCM10023233_25990 [Brevibacterium otitidis]